MISFDREGKFPIFGLKILELKFLNLKNLQNKLLVVKSNVRLALTLDFEHEDTMSISSAKLDLFKSLTTLFV